MQRLIYLYGHYMKISAGFILIVFSLTSLWLACKDGNGNQNNSSNPVLIADTSNNTSEFESEVEAYESEDRVIWQKPDLVIEQLGDVQGKVVADLGAGTGYFSRRIAYKGATVIAIDIDPQAIQWMEIQRLRFPEEIRDRLIIRKAEPDNPHLENGEVDVVLMVNTYSYIQNRIEYFSKLKNAIRRGGNMVIIDFKKKKTPFGPPIEERLDENQVIDELQKAGYSILKTDNKSLDYQYIIKAHRD